MTFVLDIDGLPNHRFFIIAQGCIVECIRQSLIAT